MNRRLDRSQRSSEKLHFSFTLQAEDRIKGLAYYLEVPYSRLLRDLAREKRRALYDAGKRPPLKPKDDAEHFTGPRNDGEERVYRNIRVAPDEKDEIVALAQYLGLPYGQMLVELADAKRQALCDNNKRPPLRPPDDGAFSHTQGKRTPER